MNSSLLIKLTLFALVGLGTYSLATNQDNDAYSVLIFIAGGAIMGIIGALLLAPAIGEKVSDMFYNAPEKAEPDPGSAARAKVAQGDYKAAVQEFIKLADHDPTDRTPWVEAIRLQREKLNDPSGALATCQSALAAHEWEMDDEAYFRFRIVEIAKDELDNRMLAADTLQSIIDKFPETRNSANASHMLRELAS
ncbi:hypothetical protein [Sulfuriroseicoccus oceanibius]|uniref:Tetratricopeptide repeat protein n=1 Tax=Sulfuriroseicoccus oceanibius TaxID=2707525 RepID=A0A6B3L3V1_9BACT|nr:hypothetical protein [Sulfuriroseicoccus oceanibius]QQL45792.1 hypothetical protein G3M56_004195 [Sulfuriroseicoccus oceanibius]